MNQPAIGMLAWEGGKEQSLSQLETIPGNIVHSKTFTYPIMISRVKGANYRTVVVQPCANILLRMIDAAKAMEAAGVKAITTSCGFNAIFQKELANAVSVPVFTSSLIQVPLVHRMLKQDQRVGIITADKPHLTKKHLEAVGITDSLPVCITGIEDTEEFSKVRMDPDADLNVQKFIREIVATAKAFVNDNPKLGAIVLECTDLPPASAAIRNVTKLPVFDIVTLTDMVYVSVAGSGWAVQHSL